MFQVNIASLSQVNVMIAQGVNLLPRLRHRLIASSSSGFKYKLFILISEGINMPEIRLDLSGVRSCFSLFCYLQVGIFSAYVYLKTRQVHENTEN